MYTNLLAPDRLAHGGAVLSKGLRKNARGARKVSALTPSTAHLGFPSSLWNLHGPTQLLSWGDSVEHDAFDGTDQIRANVRNLGADTWVLSNLPPSLAPA